MNEFDIFPIVEEDFLNSYALDALLSWIKNKDYFFDRHRSSIEYWNKKCIYYNENYVPDDIRYILRQICLGMRKYIQINLPDSRYLYSEFPQIVKWKEGDVMTPHADNIEQDNMTPNASPWRDFGGVLYLNSDFRGGEIYYPNLGIQISPKPGMIVLHPAGIKYTHGVLRVTEGERYTMSTFFTYDINHAGFLPE